MILPVERESPDTKLRKPSSDFGVDRTLFRQIDMGRHRQPKKVKSLVKTAKYVKFKGTRPVRNAFEFEEEVSDRHGRTRRRRISVGPVLITSVSTLLLALTGHSVWSVVVSLAKELKWW